MGKRLSPNDPYCLLTFSFVASSFHIFYFCTFILPSYIPICYSLFFFFTFILPARLLTSTINLFLCCLLFLILFTFTLLHYLPLITRNTCDIRMQWVGYESPMNLYISSLFLSKAIFSYDLILYALKAGNSSFTESLY